MRSGRVFFSNEGFRNSNSSFASVGVLLTGGALGNCRLLSTTARAEYLFFGFPSGRSGEHNQAIQCIKQLEIDGSQAAGGGTANADDDDYALSFLFAKCKASATLQTGTIFALLCSWKWKRLFVYEGPSSGINCCCCVRSLQGHRMGS